MKKNYERVAEINARLRALAELMKTEERDLTDAERGEVSTLEREKTYLTMQMRATMPDMPEEKKAMTRAQRFKAGLRAIVDRGGRIELRAGEENTQPSAGANVMMTDDIKKGGLFPITIQDIVKPLREELIYNKIGIEMPTGCRGGYEWPIVEAVEAQIAGENEELDEQKINLDKVATITQRIGVSVSATRESLFNSEGKLERLISELLPAAMADKLNKILVSPEKVNESCAITGPFVGLTKGSLKADYKSFNKAKAALLAKGVKSANMVWVMTEAMKAELEATPRDAGSGLMCIENDRLCGLPVFCHSAVGENTVGVGDFAYQVAGQFGDFYFVVDPYTGAGSNKVKFTLNADYGTATVRKEVFALYEVQLS